MDNKKVSWISINDAEVLIYPKDLTYKPFLQDLDKTLENETDFILVNCEDGAALIGLKNVWQMKIGFKYEV